jgi:hypothetical protein
LQGKVNDEKRINIGKPLMVRKKTSAKRVYVVEKNGQLKMVPLFF